MIVVTVLSTTFVALFCLVACTTREVPVTPVPPEVVFATVEREVTVFVEVTREVPVDVAVPETVVVEKEVVVTREVGVTVEVEKVVTRTVPETVQIEVTREVPCVQSRSRRPGRFTSPVKSRSQGRWKSQNRPKQSGKCR